jgi:hypothetical protein
VTVISASGPPVNATSPELTSVGRIVLAMPPNVEPKSSPRTVAAVRAVCTTACAGMLAVAGVAWACAVLIPPSRSAAPARAPFTDTFMAVSTWRLLVGCRYSSG